MDIYSKYPNPMNGNSYPLDNFAVELTEVAINKKKNYNFSNKNEQIYNLQNIRLI